MVQGGIRWNFSTSPTPPPEGYTLLHQNKILKKFKKALISTSYNTTPGTLLNSS